VTVRFEGRRTAAENTESDRALLQAGERAGRVAVLSDRSLSLGVAQSLDTPSARRARERSWAVGQRSTGGTGVLHLPGDIAWAMVLPRDHPAVGRDFVRAYDRLGRGVVEALAPMGAAVSWGPPIHFSADFCLLGPRGRVLSREGRVLGGAAQHATGAALLHHGVVALRVDRTALRELFELSDAALDHVTCLRELGVPLPAEEIAQAIAARLLPDDGT
jgi:lipoate-protein ligase A